MDFYETFCVDFIVRNVDVVTSLSRFCRPTKISRRASAARER